MSQHLRNTFNPSVERWSRVRDPTFPLVFVIQFYVRKNFATFTTLMESQELPVLARISAHFGNGTVAETAQLVGPDRKYNGSPRKHTVMCCKGNILGPPRQGSASSNRQSLALDQNLKSAEKNRRLTRISETAPSGLERTIIYNSTALSCQRVICLPGGRTSQHRNISANISTPMNPPSPQFDLIAHALTNMVKAQDKEEAHTVNWIFHVEQFILLEVVENLSKGFQSVSAGTEELGKTRSVNPASLEPRDIGNSSNVEKSRPVGTGCRNRMSCADDGNTCVDQGKHMPLNTVAIGVRGSETAQLKNTSLRPR
ncbi:hypothetical protein B0H16DRAFT_1456706 [Mycena metata]|uniref:Uncharacterized protein n=1 Tax=Mycena metata TaxID=1033252 RepID=A0AAD7J971_9AGAR|nr:hypothetical protein B0H16DRAFT_1456706 [Mycena metata]